MPIKRRMRRGRGDNPPMAQGKRISADIDVAALEAIKNLGASAKAARIASGEGQAVAAERLGVHVQTIARIESGEPGVAIGHRAHGRPGPQTSRPHPVQAPSVDRSSSMPNRGTSPSMP